MRTRLFVAAAAIWTLVGCSDATGPKTTAKTTLQGQAVIHAPADPQFSEKERFIIAGRRLSRSACAFDRRVRVYQGDHFTERVVEFDPTTCMFVFARGDHAPAEIDIAQNQNMTVLGSSSTASISQTPRFSLISQALHSPWQRVYHEDPLQIDVTASKIEFDFSNESGCAHAWGSRHFTQWFTQSGWSLASQTHFMSPRLQCLQIAYARGTSNFINHNFCYPGSITYAWYTKNEIEGWADGQVWMSNAGSAEGPCSDALTYHYEYAWT